MNTCTVCLQQKPDVEPLDADFAVMYICNNCAKHLYDALRDRYNSIQAEREV